MHVVMYVVVCQSSHLVAALAMARPDGEALGKVVVGVEARSE